MRYLIIFSIFIPSLAFASLHRMAMISNSTVQNIAVWDDVQAWSPAGYTLVNIDSQPQVGIGWTCSKCDGTDFVAPSGQ